MTEQFYLSPRWDPYMYYQSGLSKLGNKLEPYHQMQFSVIPKRFVKGSYLTLDRCVVGVFSANRLEKGF